MLLFFLQPGFLKQSHKLSRLRARPLSAQWGHEQRDSHPPTQHTHYCHTWGRVMMVAVNTVVCSQAWGDWLPPSLSPLTLMSCLINSNTHRDWENRDLLHHHENLARRPSRLQTQTDFHTWTLKRAAEQQKPQVLLREVSCKIKSRREKLGQFFFFFVLEQNTEAF